MSNKNKIAETTFLLSLKNGFDNVSIKQIQEESGLAAGSIYYHFKDKNDILLYMVNKYIVENLEQYKETIRNFKGTFIERLKFIFHYILGSEVESEINFTNVTRREELNYKNYYLMFMGIYHQHEEVQKIYEDFNDELYEFYKELIQEAIENNEIRDDIDIKKLTLFILTGLKGYVDIWMYQPQFSLEEIIDANVEMIAESIKKQ